MPEISALPALPPVVGPMPAPGVVPAPVTLSFLATLKSALSGLATIAMPQAAPTLTPSVPTLDVQPAPDEKTPVEDPKTPSPEVMPEMLAALGFLPVPPVLQPEPQPQTVAAAPTQTAPTPVALATSAPAPTSAAPSDVPAPLPTSAAPLDPKSLADLPKDTNLPVPPIEVPPTPVQPHTTHHSTLRGDTPPAPRHREGSVPVASDTTPVVQSPAATTTHSNSSQTQTGDGDPQQSSSQVTPPITTTLEATTPDLKIEVAAAGMTSAAPIAHTALPPHVRPSEVVNQIAHQADLYRLPGNKGVRIQLHPEDLGGVDVTLRYSAAGGIQLHINVEHASTGALVQAGWNDLRDALATQGITPDRLIMSVSATGQSSSMDFSSNSQNGYRSDAGQMSFDQGGQDQRQDSEPQRVARAWFGDSDAPTPDDPRVSVSNGRIDYQV